MAAKRLGEVAITRHSDRCPFCNPTSVLIGCHAMCPECRHIYEIHLRAETDARAEAESQRWIREHAAEFRTQRLSEATK